METLLGILSLVVAIAGYLLQSTDKLLKEMRDLERETTELLREIRDALGRNKNP